MANPADKTLAPEKTTVQSQMPPCSFTVGNDAVVIPLKKDELTGGNVIVRFKRPYRDGEKLDDTHAVARVWVCTAIYGNNIQEPGVGADEVLYPDLMLRTLRMFLLHETGDLVVPTDGLVRARAEGYKRITPDELIDYAELELTFVEDSEDGVTSAAFANPTVAGRQLRVLEQTSFSAEEEDGWSDLVTQIVTLGSELEGTLRAPGRAVEDSRAQASAIQGAVTSLARTATGVFAQARGEGTQGPAVKTEARCVELIELMSRVDEDRQSSLPARRPYSVTRPTTVFILSRDVGQPVDALMDLNPSIQDPFYVPAGTYQVYERWP